MKYLIIFVLIIVGFLITWNNQLRIEYKLSLPPEPPLEFQSTYVRTVDGFDIIHICGTHVFTESGEFDVCFPARNQALPYAEELSAHFVNQFEE